MNKILLKIYQFVMGGKPKCLLDDLFKNAVHAKNGFVLQEVGLPHGEATAYCWWKDDNASYFLQTSRKLGDTDLIDVKQASQIDNEHFSEILSTIKKADESGLQSHIGTTRDGVTYSVVWGDRGFRKRLVFSNPPIDSKQLQLVDQLKKAAGN